LKGGNPSQTAYNGGQPKKGGFFGAPESIDDDFEDIMDGMGLKDDIKVRNKV
jgi:hypothetical protein